MTRGPAAHVFVDDLERPDLSAADRHHIERVLRLRPGEEITLCDGRGRWRRCRFRTGAEPEPVGDAHADPRPWPPITVAFALTKGERPEWTVQKLTEVGVDTIVPFTAARSIVRWTSDRAAVAVERWRRISREAASQSRRTWLPEVEDVTTFAAVIGRPGATLAHPAGEKPTLDEPGVTVLIGPEGGWSDDELAAGRPVVSLGPHVLRAETAAIAAGVLLSALRANILR